MTIEIIHNSTAIEIIANTNTIEITTAGMQGIAGKGFPAGGSTNQVLQKIDGTDYNTQWHSLSKSDVGLSNVDNTSDANKPISSATQTALNAKVNNTDIISIAQGGTGQNTQQNAINALTAVSSATNEYILTKDTATGNAIFKPNATGNPNFANIISGTNTSSSMVIGTGASLTATGSGSIVATDVSNSSVIAKVLTGFSALAGTVTASDSILSAFQKIVGNISNLVTGVSSVFGRTGAIIASNGDYTASQITNTPAGNIASITVQGALNELDNEKQPLLGYTAENIVNKVDILGTPNSTNYPSTTLLNLIKTNLESYAIAMAVAL